MSEPKRIQRKRTKGWKMPPNTVYVGRPSVFGNPFEVEKRLTAEQAVKKFEAMMNGDFDGCSKRLREHKENIMANLHKLRGKNLACWCKESEPCHADVLLKIANER